MNVRALPAPLTLPRLRITAAVAGWTLLLLVGLAMAPHLGGGDAMIFYTVRMPEPYVGSELGRQGFMYSPVAAQVLGPLQALPFGTFSTLLTLIEMAALAYLVGPWLAVGAVALQVPLVWDDLVWGNLQLSATVLVVLALRHAPLYSVLLLTKVTPAVGIVYHLARREWRHVGMAVGITLAVIAVSSLFAPALWVEWFSLLASSGSDATPNRMAVPFLLRAPLAVGLAGYGGISGKVWLVPIAAAVASPEGGPHWLLVLGAIPLMRALGQDRSPDAVRVGRRGDGVIAGVE